ncbi:adhesion G protein-coupled receptor L3-like isoform X2 [Physella acuta]|uniref:adhesion G protein-coupled receptor L3-like isoform X2 n=1 Tax=Physella acuta TaxID=109671 RepID=UPI0027DC1B11|nr:adhesion G protein-coupled receptor L3-like isoform X2 [Physella acuta]
MGINGQWSSLGRWILYLRRLVVVCFFCLDVAANGDVKSAAAMNSVFACENDTLKLECSFGEVIRIDRANYGRFSLMVCNPHGLTEGWNTNCFQPRTFEIISVRCDGRQACSLLVDSHVFGDPCPSTHKYAEVRFSCARDLLTTKAPLPPLITYNDGTPKPPIVTSLTAIDPTSLKIEWTHDPDVTVFTTAVYIAKDGHGKNVKANYFTPTPNSTFNSQILENLDPNTTYYIFLKSVGKHMGGSSPTYSVSTPPLDESDMAPIAENAIENVADVDNLSKDMSAQTHTQLTQSENVDSTSFESSLYPHLDPTQSNSREAPSEAEKRKLTVKIRMYTSRSKTPSNERADAPILSDEMEGDGSQEPEPIMEAVKQITFAKSPVLETEQKHNTKMELQQKQELKDTKPHFVLDFGDSEEVLDTTPVTVTTPDVQVPQISTEKTTPTQGQIMSDLVTEHPAVSLAKNWTSPERQKNDNPALPSETRTDQATGSRPSYGEFKNMSSQDPGPDRFSTIGGPPENVDEGKGFQIMPDEEPYRPAHTPHPPATKRPTTTTTAKERPTSTTTFDLPSGDTTPIPVEKEVWTSTTPIYDPSEHNGLSGFCGRLQFEGINWPRTQIGRSATAKCPPPLLGMSSLYCSSIGWDKSGPDMSGCTSPWVNDIDAKIMQGLHSADHVAVELSAKIKESDMSSGDLMRTATKLLPKLARSLDYNKTDLDSKNKMRKFKRAFLESSSSLLVNKHMPSWKRLSRQYRKKAATTLIVYLEETGFHVSKHMEMGTTDVEIDNNIVMEMNVINSRYTHSDLSFPARQILTPAWNRDLDFITISKGSMKHIGNGGRLDVLFTLYKNMEELMQPQTNTVSTFSASDSNYNAGTISDSSSIKSTSDPPTLVINSNIIGASINNSQLDSSLPEPVRFTLHHLQTLENAAPVCSFWNIEIGQLVGQWSQDGCRLLHTNLTHTTCECDHLTNFAVLMDISGVKLSEENELALRVITFVGCVISIVCLMLSWTTFMVFKNLQCDRNTIHKNLVLCLLLAEILFLGGIAQTEPKIVCSIIAGVLHYLFLGAFAWMCLEGVQLYVMLVEVFEQERSRVMWYYMFGYGVPAVIVGISAGIYHQGYGTARHCWLTTEKSFIWSFVGPALAVMMVNIIMLGIAIYTMCRHSNMSATMKERSKATKFSAWLKGAIVLAILLGLTWLLGVLYLNEESVVIAYCFTILNSLQGMFIFFFHCIRNEKVQKEYRKVARRTSWLPNCIRVNYGGYTGVQSSSPIVSSGSGNYLSRIFGPGRNKKSATSTNSSAKPFLSKDQHRRSDTENSASRDSSAAPSSLNGYYYSPGYPNGNPYMKATAFENGNGLKGISNGHAQLPPFYETGGMVGELSEYIDCSVIDSEYVSEYCQHNMQVCMEEKRYSTGSEDSKIVPAPIMIRENDNLSTLSLASSSRKPSSLVSSSECVTSSLRDGLDYKQAESLQKEGGGDPRLNLNQYIIPTSRKNNNNNKVNVTNHQGGDSLKPRVPDSRSFSLNKLAKPAASLSSIPETETSPQHSSTPNLQYKLGFNDPQSESGSSTTANTPDSLSHFRNIPMDSCEEMSPSSTMDSPSSIKSSLPNLEALSIECMDNPDLSSLKRRHSSENDVQFSPFRFTSTDC